MVDRKDAEFQKHFGVNDRFQDVMVSKVTRRYSLDVIEFDKWLHTLGYTEEEHGSMKDFIQVRFGQEAVSFIEGLL